MWVRARSKNIPVSRAKCAAVEKSFVKASTVLLASSTASENTAAAAVPISDERATAVAGDNTENYATTEGRSATSSEMVPEVIEEQQKSDKEAAPAVSSTAVDQNGKIRASSDRNSS